MKANKILASDQADPTSSFVIIFISITASPQRTRGIGRARSGRARSGQASFLSHRSAVRCVQRMVFFCLRLQRPNKGRPFPFREDKRFGPVTCKASRVQRSAHRLPMAVRFTQRLSHTIYEAEKEKMMDTKVRGSGAYIPSKVALIKKIEQEMRI